LILDNSVSSLSDKLVKIRWMETSTVAMNNWPETWQAHETNQIINYRKKETCCSFKYSRAIIKLTTKIANKEVHNIKKVKFFKIRINKYKVK